MVSSKGGGWTQPWTGLDTGCLCATLVLLQSRVGTVAKRVQPQGVAVPLAHGWTCHPPFFLYFTRGATPCCMKGLRWTVGVTLWNWGVLSRMPSLPTICNLSPNRQAPSNSKSQPAKSLVPPALSRNSLDPAQLPSQPSL